MAKYFHLDPVVILRTYSVGDVVEALLAMETYLAIEEAQKPKQDNKPAGRQGAAGRWL